MAVWRCPHCATPQSEAARCWVCHRSTTSCGTCRHFRRSIASGLGVCGLDPRHVALTGAEMRACWTPPDAVLGDEPDARRVPVLATEAHGGARAPRTFVPVDDPAPSSLESVRHAASPPVTTPSATPADHLRPSAWSLWGDPEP